MTMIEVASVQPAAPGKKLGKVMTTGGESYSGWPDKIGAMKPGERYEIEYTEEEFNGRPWRKLTKATPAKNGGNGHTKPSQPTANPNEAEWTFVREMLTVGLRTGAVAFSAHDLRTAIAMLRGVWRELS